MVFSHLVHFIRRKIIAKGLQGLVKEFGLFISFITLLTNFGLGQSVGFVENQGQYHNQDYVKVPHVKYVGKNQQGLQVQLRDKGFSYELISEKKNQESEKNTKIDIHRVDIDFIGANTNIEIAADDAHGSHINYYLSGKRYENIQSYREVTY